MKVKAEKRRQRKAQGKLNLRALYRSPRLDSDRDTGLEHRSDRSARSFILFAPPRPGSICDPKG